MKEYRIRDNLPVEEFASYMGAWEKKKPNLVTVSAIGKSGGYDILKAVFTDSSVPDDDKQVVLLLAQHSMELSGVTTLLSVGNYLVSDAEEVKEWLKKLIIVMIPCSNAYSYSKQDPKYQFKNEAGIDEYYSFDYNGACRDEKTAPAAHAIQKTVDFYKPELIMDVHGVYYQDTLVIESLGISGNAGSRYYNNEFVHRIQQAGTKAGYAMTNFDDWGLLLQTDHNCTDDDVNVHYMPSYQASFGADRFQVQVYSYYKYHTLVGAFETAFEEACVPRILEAFRIGCEVWGGEYYSGYPTRTVVPCVHNSIRPYGNTAEMRRNSRVELWQNKKSLQVGVGHPQTPGLSVVFVCTEPSKAEEIFETSAENISRSYHLTQKIFADMSKHCDVNAEEMSKILDEHYPTHMNFDRVWSNMGDVKLKHGMTIRLGLPFADARNYKVYYNGFEQKEDELDGYTVVKYNNWVYIDLHIPADKISPFAIAMVKYDCTVPPAGIMEF